MKSSLLAKFAFGFLIILGLERIAFHGIESYFQHPARQIWPCAKKEIVLAKNGFKKIIAFRKACGGLNQPKRIELRLIDGFFDRGQTLFIFEPFYTYDGHNVVTPPLGASWQSPGQIKISLARVWHIDQQIANLPDTSIAYDPIVQMDAIQ